MLFVGLELLMTSLLHPVSIARDHRGNKKYARDDKYFQYFHPPLHSTSLAADSCAIGLYKMSYSHNTASRIHRKSSSAPLLCEWASSSAKKKIGIL